VTQQRLRLLVLPEDSGVDGFATIKTVVRHLLEYIEPNGVLWKDEGRDHEWIDPRTREELTLVHAAAWKVERPSDPALIEQKRDLKRAVVTHLLLHETFDGQRKPIGFVFFHHDGDDAWSSHTNCTLCQQFRDFLLELEQTVRAVINRDERLQSDDPDTVVGRALSRLFPVEPHWSVEAWLLGKSERARTLCVEKHHGLHDGPNAWWQISRAELEERSQPKKSCLKDCNNLALARVFDAKGAYGESPSFTALADSVLGCQDLLDALHDVATGV